MKKINKMTNIAMIAAIYFIVSMAFQFMAYSAVQVRVAEALIVTAIVSKQGIYGTTLGCLITNAIGVALGVNGFGGLDIIFGTLFTLIAAIIAYNFRDYVYTKMHLPLISLMAPVIINAIGLPFVFAFAFHQKFVLSVYMMEFGFVFLGQFISCVILGSILYLSAGRQLKLALNK